MKKTQSQIIEEFKETHKDYYDYSKVVYIKISENVIITCPFHGDFPQTPDAHKRGQGCSKCADIRAAKIRVERVKSTLIEDFRKIHGNEYDYTKVDYVKASKDVIITCKIHGDFLKTPNRHKNGEGCPDCAEIRKKETVLNKGRESIISRIKEVHGDLYDLSRVDYKGMKKPIIIGCSKHGWKEMTPNTIIYGKSGCSDCGRERSEAAKYRSFEDVLSQARTVHNNKYDYSKITDYTETSETYTIGCPIHGDFEQVFANHISGRGCDKCGRESTSKKRRLSQEEVIERCIKVYGDIYDLSKIKYITDKKPIEVICKKHGSFPSMPINFMRGHGCSKCGDERVAEHFRENPVGWGLRAWKETANSSKNFDSFKVYKVKCFNDEEEFYKIGRTFLTVTERLKGNMNGYAFETIEVIEGTAEEMYELETQLKREHREFKYIPKINFGGRYECFSKIICTIAK